LSLEKSQFKIKRDPQSKQGEYLPVKILTHGDTDGVCSAALAKARFPEAEVWFTRPVTFGKDLEEVERGTTLVVLDIAISETHKTEIFQKMRELAHRDEVLYIDHHPLPPDTLREDVPASQFVHTTSKSTSELTFNLFESDLPSELDRVALWGAIADYATDTEFVHEKLNKYDRRTIYMEAGLLSQALGEAGGNYHYKREVVERLAKAEPPSEIPEIVDRALKSTKREWEVWKHVREHVAQEDNLAIVYDLPSGSLGKAALFALGVTGKDVGICTRRNGDEVDLSIRRREGTKLDLNTLLRRITSRIGGSGGGHEGAAGASIPVELFDDFFEILKKEVSPIISRDVRTEK
jgi:RecJ-like exonuclease